MTSSTNIHISTEHKIYVAGHRGLAGSAILRSLEKKGYKNLCFASRDKLNLLEKKAVQEFFNHEKPDCVILAAAKVGGIQANNTYPVDFLQDNLTIQNNIFKAAFESKHPVKKLVFLGSSCIYPKLATQPLKEEYLLTGELEPTNEPYALAKIVGIKLAQSYRRQYGVSAISLMPTNLYGPNDYFNLENSHVVPALLKKFHDAKVDNASEVIVWGTGKPMREFLHVDDMADATTFLMEHYDSSDPINVGTGEDITIAELATLVCKVVGFGGKIVYDTSKPDGTPRKVLDVSKINSIGWRAQISLESGLHSTYEWMLHHNLRD